MAKLTGIVFAIGAGVIAGKEGPFVHGGGIVGGGIGGMGSMCVLLHSNPVPCKALLSHFRLTSNSRVASIRSSMHELVGKCMMPTRPRPASARLGYQECPEQTADTVVCADMTSCPGAEAVLALAKPT